MEQLQTILSKLVKHFFISVIDYKYKVIIFVLADCLFPGNSP